MGRGVQAAAWGLACWLVYGANGRSIGAGDVVPASYLAVALVRGDGVVLDRYDRQLRGEDGRLPGYLDQRRGHLVSRYPIGPAVLAAPLAAPLVWWLDRVEPGWDQRADRAAVRRRMEWIGKTTASALTAAAVGVLAVVLGRLGYRGGAVGAAVAAAAWGTGYWPVASQALWQHGPAVLCLTVAVLGLSGGAVRAGEARPVEAAGEMAAGCGSRPVVLPPVGLGAAAWAGAATAWMVVCRTVDAVLAAVIALWVLRHLGRPARWAFFVPAITIGGLWAAYNIWFFDTLIGGYAAIERMHPWAHGTRGTFSGSLLGGGLGTLVSPSHGLLVYSPWVLVAAVGMVSGSVRRRLFMEGGGLTGWLMVGLVPLFGLLATYSCWWGGHCFGARFWIDATPVLAIALAAVWERMGGVVGRWTVGVLIGWSVGVHAVGFACYPSTWHSQPTNVDRDHRRLWDWRDNEVTRGVREGIRPRMW
jgi:hypothetical protein